ncbi:MAG: PadR family transcriptional regulator [Propionicimonas sp.]
MSLPQTLLGLLAPTPSHGYDLKHSYDEHFGRDKPVSYTQVYAALARLLNNGMVEVAGIEQGEGPERKRYALTEAGVTQLSTWLDAPEEPALYLQSTLYTKVVLALLSGRSATDVLDVQRGEHLRLMRVLTRRKAGADLATQLVCDHALFHLEADLRWLELTAARVDQLGAQVRAGART